MLFINWSSNTIIDAMIRHDQFIGRIQLTEEIKRESWSDSEHMGNKYGYGVECFDVSSRSARRL